MKPVQTLRLLSFVPAKDITIYDAYHRPPVGYQPVARLSRPGNRGDHKLILGALEWRARMLGANGLILGDAEDLGQRNGMEFGNDRMRFATTGPGESMFQAIAIVATNTP